MSAAQTEPDQSLSDGACWPAPSDVDAAQRLLADGHYVADRSLATAVFLALKLGRPLFLEGEAGVGKTEIAKVLADTLGRELIRLQCYEGLDAASAAYEWNYPRQMVAIRLHEAAARDGRTQSASAAGGIDSGADLAAQIYAPEYLLARPLLRALQPPAEDAGFRGAPVLLIDELDRTDEPFEAFLLEVLADFQISIPELGAVRAAQPPIVVITSNRTREIHDALKRRCFYYWVDYPSAERELEIVRVKVPQAGDQLSRQVVAFVQKLRGEQADLFKQPGVAETLDWAQALLALDALQLTPELINDTLGALLKYQDDIASLHGSEAARLLGDIQAELAATG